MAFLATYILERLLLIGVKIFRIGMWCIEFPAADRWYTNDALNSQFFYSNSKIEIATGDYPDSIGLLSEKSKQYSWP
jgi:hypothetical protein